MGFSVFRKTDYMIKEIDIERIVEPKRDSRFYRDEQWELYLTEDLSVEGMRIPILVRPIQNEKFEVVEGISRYRALKREDAKTIRCDVQDLNDTDALVFRIKMNTMRKHACYVAMAQDFAELRAKKWRVTDIAQRFHIGKSWVTKILSLNKLSDEDKLRVAKGELTVSDAYRMNQKVSLINKNKETSKCDCCGKQEKASLVSRRNLCMRCDALLAEAHKRTLKYAKDKKLTTF